MSDYEDEYLSEENDFDDKDYDNEDEDYTDESYTKHKYYKPPINSENDSDGTNDSDYDTPRKKTELELLREKNIKEGNKFLESLMEDPVFAEIMSSAEEVKKQKKNVIPRTTKDPSFRSTGVFGIPLEKRRSSRLQNLPPVFFKEDLIDETTFNRKRKRSEEYDYYELENVVYRPRISRPSTKNTSRPRIIPIEEVTDKMIANIARRGTNKVYSNEGTSCHQCRQKTVDQKTCCRNERCAGVRGQFCGVCLENRYGEDAAVALKDPHWKCPVCRDICNCSFCRQKAGKRPTGILAPLAQQNGHKSVKDFLESLKGEGDYSQHDSLWQRINSPQYLLGYSKDSKFAVMGRNVKHEVEYFLMWDKLNEFIWAKQSELESIIDLHDEPRNLLGFFSGTNKGLLDDGTECYMGP